MLGHHPALEVSAVKIGTAITVHVHVLRHTFLQSRRRHDDLEHRPGRELRLNGLIQQRMIIIVHQLVPLVPGNLHCETIWIEGGPTNHRQHFAGAGVQRHDGTVPAIQRLLGGNLQVQIDRQFQLLARFRGSLVQPPDFAAAAVDERAPRAVLSH